MVNRMMRESKVENGSLEKGFQHNVSQIMRNDYANLTYNRLREEMVSN